MSGQAPQPAIRMPGGIWAKLIDQSNANAKKPDNARGDAFVYFVGSRGSGKSTLLNRFLYPSRYEMPKPSEGLEYTYARKPSTFDHEKKDLAHIWEVGGSQDFAASVVKGAEIFLNPKQVLNAVVVIVVDLSDPGSALSTLLTWLTQIKEKLASTYEKFEKKGIQIPEQLRARAKGKLYSQNEDKDIVYHSGISIVITGTKYDVFREQDPECKKTLSRALRYIAHTNGAHLMYTGGLHGSTENTREQAAERAALDNFSRLMNHLMFTGLEKKPQLKSPPVMDHSTLLMVPAGSDTLREVGKPRGGPGDADLVGGVLEWRAAVDKVFPPKVDKGRSTFEIPAQYKEDDVDAARQRKMVQLEAYRKEQEGAKDMAAKKKLAAAQAAAAAPKKKAPAAAPAAKAAAPAGAKPAAAKAPAAAAAGGAAAAAPPKPAAKPVAAPAAAAPGAPAAAAPAPAAPKPAAAAAAAPPPGGPAPPPAKPAAPRPKPMPAPVPT